MAGAGAAVAEGGWVGNGQGSLSDAPALARQWGWRRIRWWGATRDEVGGQGRGVTVMPRRSRVSAAVGMEADLVARSHRRRGRRVERGSHGDAPSKSG